MSYRASAMETEAVKHLSRLTDFLEEPFSVRSLLFSAVLPCRTIQECAIHRLEVPE